MTTKWHQVSPKWSQMIPKWSQIIPRLSQMTPKVSQMTQWPQLIQSWSCRPLVLLYLVTSLIGAFWKFKWTWQALVNILTLKWKHFASHTLKPLKGEHKLLKMQHFDHFTANKKFAAFLTLLQLIKPHLCQQSSILLKIVLLIHENIWGRGIQNLWY